MTDVSGYSDDLAFACGIFCWFALPVVGMAALMLT
jgi:hypothetical protein